VVGSNSDLVWDHDLALVPGRGNGKDNIVSKAADKAQLVHDTRVHRAGEAILLVHHTDKGRIDSDVGNMELPDEHDGAIVLLARRARVLDRPLPRQESTAAAAGLGLA